MIFRLLIDSCVMCGLYSFRRSPEETRTLFNYLERPDFPPRQYVTPGGPMAIVRQNHSGRHFGLVRWGFVPSWAKEVQPGKPLINARSETILEKPSFRNAIRRRRCLIPADGFYEWEGDVPGKKRPYFIHRPDHGLMAFAGIWEHWLGPDGSELETAAIITTANIHVFHIAASLGRAIDMRQAKLSSRHLIIPLRAAKARSRFTRRHVRPMNGPFV